MWGVAHWVTTGCCFCRDLRISSGLGNKVLNDGVCIRKECETDQLVVVFQSGRCLVTCEAFEPGDGIGNLAGGVGRPCFDEVFVETLLGFNTSANVHGVVPKWRVSSLSGGFRMA